MSPRYDIFLSHSSADKPAVEELARKLVEAGIAGDWTGSVHFFDLVEP
jgi:hypothetical protein